MPWQRKFLRKIFVVGQQTEEALYENLVKSFLTRFGKTKFQAKQKKTLKTLNKVLKKDGKTKVDRDCNKVRQRKNRR